MIPDITEIIKIGGIVLTAALGGFAVFGDFRVKTLQPPADAGPPQPPANATRISIWGWAMLVGIVLAALMTVFATISEDREQQQRLDETKLQLERITTRFSKIGGELKMMLPMNNDYVANFVENRRQYCNKVGSYVCNTILDPNNKSNDPLVNYLSHQAFDVSLFAMGNTNDAQPDLRCAVNYDTARIDFDSRKNTAEVHWLFSCLTTPIVNNKKIISLADIKGARCSFRFFQEGGHPNVLEKSSASVIMKFDENPVEVNRLAFTNLNKYLSFQGVFPKK